jgi:PKHD-type hydroxylase
MSNYKFAPCPTFGRTNEPYVFWKDGFSEEELAHIQALGESRNIDRATISGTDAGKDVSEIRTSKTSWINLQQDSEWLYDRLSYIARQLNGQFYNFDLYGFWEHLQYTVYDGTENGHYDWHIDAGSNDECPRKLSLVLQLSDPSEYEGGELQLKTSVKEIAIEKKKGFITVFPSYVLHRVTPVTAGVRRTLVVWVAGPAFR